MWQHLIYWVQPQALLSMEIFVNYRSCLARAVREKFQGNLAYLATLSLRLTGRRTYCLVQIVWWHIGVSVCILLGCHWYLRISKITKTCRTLLWQACEGPSLKFSKTAMFQTTSKHECINAWLRSASSEAGTDSQPP